MTALIAEPLPAEAAETAVAPTPEPEDFARCLKGPNGLDFVVELAHDLRSPLTSILFLAETLRQGQGGPVTPEQSHQLGLIYSAALGLCATASDVLELARGGHRLVNRVRSPFSVAEVFAEVRNMVLPIAQEKGLEVRLVPPVPERRLGQERALSRVLLNLATNAVKFTDSGFVELAARTLDRRRLEFSVRDTGSGLDPAGLEVLHPPVRWSSSASRHFSGTGLGLAICRKLVRAMGSKLRVETWPQQGTRFYFAVDAPPSFEADFHPTRTAA